MDALAQAYDARSHPDVKSRKRTEADVLREFLQSPMVGMSPGGMVTFAEFERYFAYHTVRFRLLLRGFFGLATNQARLLTLRACFVSCDQASIDDDDYFALMMRNAWGVAEG
eukprot:COSAG06_NODE_664_length_13285_cov_14.962853_12_plen_112_part_00